MWPIYLTIGNLSRKARHAQKVPSTILLGLLLLPPSFQDKELSTETKRILYHETVRIVLRDNIVIASS
jgi:hypothetical protein